VVVPVLLAITVVTAPVMYPQLPIGAPVGLDAVQPTSVVTQVHVRLVVVLVIWLPTVVVAARDRAEMFVGTLRR